MSKVAGLFFPWRKTFRRLELEQQWWHRLALVSFFAALIFLLFVAWLLTMNGTEPANTVLQNARCWFVDSTGNRVDLHAPPQEATEVVPEGQDANDSKQSAKLDESKASAIHAEVDMPSGETREFLGKSPKEIKTEWDGALRKARLNQALLSLGVAIGVTLVSSYLFQSLYRALLYVIYGSPKNEAA